MMWLLILLLALYAAEAAKAVDSSCPDSFTLVGDQCLLFITYAALNYQDAQYFCQASSAELATISTADQFALVVDHIREEGYSDHTFWMDGTDLTEEDRWVTSSGQLVPRGTPFWAGYHAGAQEPDNLNGNEHCLSISSDLFLYLNDIPCDHEENFICEVAVTQHRTVNVTATSPSDEGTSITLSHPSTNQTDEGKVECPLLHVEVGGLCLKFVTWAHVAWNEAAYMCGDTDERLAITDANLLREVYLYIHRESLSEYSFWLGGSDTADEGTWVYTTGEPVPMGTPFWGLNVQGTNQEPNGGTTENCLVMDKRAHHYFQDIPCSNTAYPLCVYVG